MFDATTLIACLIEEFVLRGIFEMQVLFGQAQPNDAQRA
jgi:hypothetical protein